MSISDSDRQRYRELQDELEQKTAEFDGSLAANNDVLRTLIETEGLLKKVANTEVKDRAERLQMEEQASEALGGVRVTIDGLIDGVYERFERSMDEHVENPIAIAERLEIVHRQIENVLVPPGQQEVQMGDGTAEWEEARFEGRVAHLIRALQEREIYTDDIVMTVGTVDERMIRQMSYALIEVPKIGAEVLVCNQVSEATFVSRTHRSLATYMAHTKEALGQELGLVRIVCHDLDSWGTDVIEAMFEGWDGEGRQVNVQDMVEMRSVLQEKYTAEEWANFTQRQRREIRVLGMGLSKIARIFGVSGHPREDRYAHIELGAKIFGEDDQHINKIFTKIRTDRDRKNSMGNDAQKWKDAVKDSATSTYTAKQWLDLTYEEKGKLEVEGKKLGALATLFGLKGNPRDDRVLYLELTSRIFGKNNPTILAAKKVLEKKQEGDNEMGDDREKWRSAVQKQYSLDEWMKLSSSDGRKQVKVKGKKVPALATIFGVNGNARDDRCVYLELGIAIFGDKNQVVAKELALEEQRREKRERRKEAAKKMGTNTEEWKKVLAEKYSAQQWVSMTQTIKKDVEVNGRKLRAIASIFSIDGNPVSNHDVHIQIAARIFGADDPAIRAAMEKHQVERKPKPADNEGGQEDSISTSL